MQRLQSILLIVFVVIALIATSGCKDDSKDNPTGSGPVTIADVAGTWLNVGYGNTNGTVRTVALDTNTTTFVLQSNGDWRTTIVGTSVTTWFAGHSSMNGDTVISSIDSSSNGTMVGATMRAKVDYHSNWMVFLSYSSASYYVRRSSSSGVIAGFVLDQQNQSLTSASILIPLAAGSPLTTTSQTDGFFAISQIATGTYHVQADYAGRSVTRTGVFVQNGGLAKVVLNIPDASTGLTFASLAGNWKQIGWFSSTDSTCGVDGESISFQFYSNGNFYRTAVMSSVSYWWAGHSTIQGDSLFVTIDSSSHSGDSGRSFHSKCEMHTDYWVSKSTDGYVEYYAKLGVSSGTLSGFVKDNSGKAINNAAVSFQIGSGTPITTSSDSYGNYYFGSVTPGVYNGLATITINSISHNAGLTNVNVTAQTVTIAEFQISTGAK